MADSGIKRNIPIKLGDFSVIDTEFSNIRERFDAEMRKMEDEMSRFRSELMNRESNNFFKSTTRYVGPVFVFPLAFSSNRETAGYGSPSPARVSLYAPAFRIVVSKCSRFPSLRFERPLTSTTDADDERAFTRDTGWSCTGSRELRGITVHAAWRKIDGN